MRKQLLLKYPGSQWVYECTSCGTRISEDHDYCKPCDQRGGEWGFIGEDGEPIDFANYGVDTFQELIHGCELLIEHLQSVCESPEMQTKIDEHGNEACRIVRSRTCAAIVNLEDVLRRAKK